MAIIPQAVYSSRFKQLPQFELEHSAYEFAESDLVLDAELWVVHLPNGSNTKDSMAFVEHGIIIQYNKHDKAGQLQFESPKYGDINNHYVIRYLSGKYNQTIHSSDFNMFGYRNCYNANRVFKTEHGANEYLNNQRLTFAYPTN